jgi:diguanylate cyclase (GGDEF)-like protein
VRILIAEDDPATQNILQTTLGQLGYDILAARDGIEAAKYLRQKDAPRLAILDWMMPGMDGIEICREVRRRGDAPYTYIIMLTAKGQKKDIVFGIEAGADDYVVKPFDTQELLARVRAGRRLIELHEQLIQSREALREQATHDLLTGFWNRGAILEILERDLERARREGRCVGIAMADVDNFKTINDTYGHLTGDAVLREIAQRLSQTVRHYDAIGRYGGEEFLIVLSGCDVRSAASLSERLCASVDAHPIAAEGKLIPVTLSLGLAVDGAQNRADMTSLIRAADNALYRAKGSGGNRIELAVAADLGSKNPDSKARG